MVAQGMAMPEVSMIFHVTCHWSWLATSSPFFLLYPFLYLSEWTCYGFPSPFQYPVKTSMQIEIICLHKFKKLSLGLRQIL